MSDFPKFEEFPKISRLFREIIVTEKIDGENAVVFIPDHDSGRIYFGSRSGWLDPSNKVTDKSGFARWGTAHREELLRLGPGWHHGEWWGQGLKRGYGLKEKRFSLFNTTRWGDPATRPPCAGVTPELYRGPLDMDALHDVMERLRVEGSVAAPGFMKPEGVVVFHTAGGVLFKATLDADHLPKGAVN